MYQKYYKLWGENGAIQLFVNFLDSKNTKLVYLAIKYIFLFIDNYENIFQIVKLRGISKICKII
jgi:hypothetical protein